MADDSGPFEMPNDEFSAAFSERFNEASSTAQLAAWTVILKKWASETTEPQSRECFLEAADSLEVVLTNPMELDDALLLVFNAGLTAEKGRLREYGDVYERGINARRDGPRVSKTTPEERDAIRSRVDELTKNRSQFEAAKMVRTELQKGRCPGVNRMVVLSVDRIRKVGR